MNSTWRQHTGKVHLLFNNGVQQNTWSHCWSSQPFRLLIACTKLRFSFRCECERPSDVGISTAAIYSDDWCRMDACMVCCIAVCSLPLDWFLFLFCPSARFYIQNNSIIWNIPLFAARRPIQTETETRARPGRARRMRRNKALTIASLSILVSLVSSPFGLLLIRAEQHDSLSVNIYIRIFQVARKGNLVVFFRTFEQRNLFLLFSATSENFLRFVFCELFHSFLCHEPMVSYLYKIHVEALEHWLNDWMLDDKCELGEQLGSYTRTIFRLGHFIVLDANANAIATYHPFW